MTESSQAAGTESTGRTRLLSFVTLVAFASGVVFIGHETYRAFTDSFVAPIILSPDNELVLQNKLKSSELYGEHAKALSMRDSLQLELAAGAKAEGRLGELLASVRSSADANGVDRPSGDSSELSALRDQRHLLKEMAEQQRGLVDEARANLEAGLVTKTDLAKEAQNLSQIRVALFENDRAIVQSELSREEQGTRIELELLKLQTEMRGNRAEWALLDEKLGMIEELEEQLRARPIFQAMTRSLDVAFVPYTQIEAVVGGASVYDCVWGLLFCEPVGTVTGIVPGEVILADPWGNQARGQYAVLELHDSDAAQSKSLRVRAPDAAIAASRADVASR